MFLDAAGSNMRTLESAHSSESWPISSPHRLPTAPWRHRAV